ncbi:MAG: hypothetical protein ACJAZ2_001479 [Glaciecola sp.]|jgi:hypothetical protein
MKNWLVLLLLLVSGLVQSQTEENQWINYNQNYFKFPIHKDGIYRISYLDLINAGIGISSVDSRSIQIFGKGKEQHLYVSDGGDNVIGPSSGNQGDYIEFYAEKNDGWYDYKLFSDSVHQANPQYSMYNDTLYYFLTWNNSINNKRVVLENDIDFSSYPQSNYFWNEVDVAHNVNFSPGEMTFFGRPSPEFSPGMGWVGSTFYHEGSSVVSVNTPNAYTSGPNSMVYSRVVGLKPNAHIVNLQVSGRILKEKTFYNYDIVHFERSFSSSLLGATTAVKHLSVVTSGNSKERLAVSYLKLRYPSAYSLNDAAEFMLNVPSGGGSKDYIKITDFNNQNKTVWLFDLTNHSKISVQASGGKFEALVTNNGKERQCYLTSEAKIAAISSDVIKPVSGNSSIFKNYKSIAIAKGGADFLIVAANSLMASAEEYATYRTSTGYTAIAVDVEQLYDQYCFGIRKHPMAIRNFALEANDNWGTSLKNLLLLGKSVNVEASRTGTSALRNLVPTWGPIGADVGFTNAINGRSVLEPLIPTGRVSANSNAQVRQYLTKIQSYESAPAAPWMKNILHFGGGADIGEQAAFKNYLSTYESIIEAPQYGGKVHTFLKSSSDPLQINLSDSVTNLINSGVSLMCFFGHAYGSNFDQSIDEPENYSNTGRYSFILANSCLIGNIHTGGTGSGSERFVLAEDKGSIGFLGSSTLGVPPYLDLYSRNFYTELANDSYGLTIGEIIKNSIISIQDSSNVFNRDVCMHMTLHGDPAVVLNSHSLPDYSLYSDEQLLSPQVYFVPEEVTNEVDSFSINIIVRNIGKAITEDLEVNVKRVFGTGKDTIYSSLISNVYYKDTLEIKFPVNILEGAGLNTFEVVLDPIGSIDELSELNNIGTIPLLIKSSDITPVIPFEFAVIPDQFPILKASTGNPYASLTTYVFEIDTNENFQSSSLYKENISSAGGVIHWDPKSSAGLKAFFNSFPSTASIQNPNVYFWRVSPLVSSGERIWRNSSFQYVKDKSGWGQSHFHQYKKNVFTFLDYQFGEQNYEFIVQSKELKCIASYHAGMSNRYPLVKLDGATVCQYSTVPAEWANINVVVVDKVTLELWRYDEHGDYGHIQMIPWVKKNPGWNEENFQFFSGNTTSMDSLISFINDVPDSNYIMMYNWKSSKLPYMYKSGTPSGDNLKNLMQSMGADVDSMMNYDDNFPYILFTQKGNPSKTIDSFASSLGDIIELKGKMYNNWLDGTMTSVTIGPAKSWESFHWHVKDGETGNALDSSHIKLIAQGADGSEWVVIDTNAVQGDVLDLSLINAATYPNLKLEVYLTDDSLRTPNKLKRWQVLFEEIPEAALNPLRLTNVDLADSVQQGEEFVFTTAIENISSKDMSAMQIVYWLIDEDFNLQKASYKQLAALPSGGVLYDSVKVNTTNLNGSTGLWYEINPYSGDQPWQLEKHHFNNIHLANFAVARDKINPVLDVTFDGIHILDGDIVSPKPYVVITLDDENQYLALDDPSLIQLFLEFPDAPDSLILLDPSEYTFIAGEAPKNKARIEFQGDFPKDGIYKLKVMSQDRSSNISGKGDGLFDFTINFEVINKSSITQVLNWPNPFSTSTQFVFTLTGSVIPDQFMIQILTISGKIVREISKEEYGSINIGRNISDYKWDGTDSYGDRLANGVYLYRVLLNTDNHDFEERTINVTGESGPSSLKNKYFTKGFGKMYLFR